MHCRECTGVKKWCLQKVYGRGLLVITPSYVMCVVMGWTIGGQKLKWCNGE